MPFVYFLKSQRIPDKTYVGMTEELQSRLEQHNEGINTSTQAFRPWSMEAYVECDNQQTARVVEKYFKNTSGKEKFEGFAKSNPLHPNPKQGFFDTLTEGRAFGSQENRFMVTQEKNKNIFTLNTTKPLNKQ